MSTPGTAIARPSRTIIQTTVPRSAPSATRTPISRIRAVTEYASSPYTPMHASRLVRAAANAANPAVKRSCSSALSTHSDDVDEEGAQRPMTQRLHDARVSIAHRREVAARADIRHRKLRPRHVLQNRPEDDERPRVVELAVRGIGDDADHFDRHDARVRRAGCAGRRRRLPGTAREPGTPRPAPRRASPGRRPTRCHGPAAAAAGTDRRSRATRTPAAPRLQALRRRRLACSAPSGSAP